LPTLPKVLADLLLPEVAPWFLLVNIFLGLPVQGAVAIGVFKTMSGQPVSFGEALWPALNKIGTLIVATLLAFLGTMALSLILGLVLGLILGLAGVMLTPGAALFAGVMLGMILGLVSGLTLASALMATAHACVVEDLGLIASLKRSVELTRGHRFKIIAVSTLTGLILGLGTWVVVFVVIYALIAVAGLASGSSGLNLAILLLSSLLAPLILAVIDILVAIIYYDLRVLKEGLTIDALASVFD
ncbi:MAG: hypothetical protein LBV21_07345, partial [Candidatus Adiutrix sp.]|nr:hypothetical protein [Candidatus Adiutrix sp.]